MVGNLMGNSYLSYVLCKKKNIFNQKENRKMDWERVMKWLAIILSVEVIALIVYREYQISIY